MADPIEDFRVYMRMLWEHLRLPPPTRCQYMIGTRLQHGPRRDMIKCFRGIGKSYITGSFATWKMARHYALGLRGVDGEYQCLVTSASADRAVGQATFIRNIINTWDFLHFLRTRDGQRDSVIAFDVGPAGVMQAPSFAARGITGQLTGLRADLIIPDDVEIPSNALTQLKRDRLDQQVKEFDAIIKPGGEIKYLGTDQIEDSLYERLADLGEVDGKPLYSTFIIPARYPDERLLNQYGDALAPALRDDLERGRAYPGQPTDPERFDEKELVERATSYGRAGFALQFMLDTSLADADRYPLKLSDFVVRDVDLEVAPERVIWSSDTKYAANDLPADGLTGDHWKRAVTFGEEAKFHPYSMTLMTIDPAGRGKDRVGYCVTKELHGFLHIPKGGWGSLPGGFDEPTLVKLATKARDLKANLVVIEPNMGAGMFTELFRPVLKRIHPSCGLEDAEWSTAQKERRICDTVEPVLSRHRIVIDPGFAREDYDAHKTEHERPHGAMYQLTRITREKGALLHDDSVDALALNCSWWSGRLGVDVDKAVKRDRDRAMDRVLKNWERGVLGDLIPNRAGRPRKARWVEER